MPKIFGRYPYIDVPFPFGWTIGKLRVCRYNRYREIKKPDPIHQIFEKYAWVGKEIDEKILYDGVRRKMKRQLNQNSLHKAFQ